VVTTVVSGSVVTLTATVMASSTAVTVGQVNFCDATTRYHAFALWQVYSAVVCSPDLITPAVGELALHHVRFEVAGLAEDGRGYCMKTVTGHFDLIA
jgi:hypothetical protein